MNTGFLRLSGYVNLSKSSICTEKYRDMDNSSFDNDVTDAKFDDRPNTVSEISESIMGIFLMGYFFFPFLLFPVMGSWFLVSTQPQKLEAENNAARERLKPPDRSIKRIEVGRDALDEPVYAGDDDETGHREFEYGKISKAFLWKKLTTD